MPCYLRKIIKIRGEDSPNVRLALEQRAAGREPTGEMVTPGVLSWSEYQVRLATWDEPRRTIGISAEFYEGAEVLMFPPAWLSHAERLAAALQGKPRQAVAVGVDPGEGGADTSMAAVDRLGLIDLQSVKTPDTNVIPGMVLAFARRHGVPAERIVFDRGGGGKHHADRLRARGHDVRTVAFGESVQPNPRRGRKGTSQRVEEREERTAYVNRRAQMYGELREALDPSGENGGFAIPSRYSELCRQLAPIPLTYDGEGRLYLLPKNKKDAGSKVKTLTELIGRSPDDADALVLALHCVLHPERRAVAGAMKWGDS